MTYTSEMALCLTKSAHDEMLDALSLTKELDAHPGNHVLHTIQKIFATCSKKVCDSKTGSVLYYWHALDWNPCSEAALLIKEFFHMLDSTEYLFLRIGETVDDYRKLGNYEANPFGLAWVLSLHFDDAEISHTTVHEFNLG